MKGKKEDTDRSEHLKSINSDLHKPPYSCKTGNWTKNTTTTFLHIKKQSKQRPLQAELRLYTWNLHVVFLESKLIWTLSD